MTVIIRFHRINIAGIALQLVHAIHTPILQDCIMRSIQQTFLFKSKDAFEINNVCSTTMKALNRHYLLPCQKKVCSNTSSRKTKPTHFHDATS